MDEVEARGVKEHSIIFSALMVRAIFDGRKTQTRRVVPASSLVGRHAPPSKIAPGDRLWVREVHTLTGTARWPALPHRTKGEQWCFYREGFDAADPPVRWRSPIHMPRWASRLTLEVVRVGIERVQVIGRADVGAEGLVLAAADSEADVRAAFATHWDSFNARRGYAWGENPLVWVYAFRRIGEP